MNRISLILKPKEPFDFALSAARLHGVKHELYREEEDKLQRTLRLDGHPFWIELEGAGTPNQPIIKVEAAGEYLQPDWHAADIEQRVKKLFSLDADLTRFYQHVEGDEHLSALCSRFYGLRIMQEGSLFECMVKTIIGQQMNLSFAAALTGRLIDRCSKPMIVNDTAYPVFPAPEDVAALGYEDLTALQFSRRKAEYVIDFARLVADGHFDLEDLYSLNDEEVIARLIKLRGIGRWTAECFLLFGMGRQNLLPGADIGLRNAIRRLYRLDHQPTEAEVRSAGQAWSPWSSYMTYYLWESLNHPGVVTEIE